MMQRLIKWAALVMAVLLVIYISSHLALTAQGIYEPGTIGLGGVKNYRWAPRGFVKGFVWNRAMIMTYSPLYFIDIRLWHTDDESMDGKYPTAVQDKSL